MSPLKWFLILFYIISSILIRIIPTHRESDDTIRKKHALKTARKLYNSGLYPIDTDVETITRRLENGIILRTQPDYLKKMLDDITISHLKNAESLDLFFDALENVYYNLPSVNWID